MEWTEILKYLISLGLAGIVTFIVIYLLYKYFDKKIDNIDKSRAEQLQQAQSIVTQNNELMKYVMNNNKESMNELKNAIEKLSLHIEKSAVFYDKVIEDISNEIVSLKEQYVKVTSQIVEALLDDRTLSKRVFFDIARLLIIKYVYKCIISIGSLFDANGLHSEDKLQLLKDNIIRELERHTNECKADIQALNFDKEKIDLFISKAQTLRIRYAETLKYDILDNLKLETLAKDEHYYSTKQLIRNRLYEFLEKVQDILKETLR